MKGIFKKNQIIITALALMICAAGYLQFSNPAEDTLTETQNDTNFYLDMAELENDDTQGMTIKVDSMASNQLEEKDKYLFFFGGNYAEVVISDKEVLENATGGTTEGNSGETRNLLLIKDSFANCFAPLVAEDYDNVYMIDMRFFRGDMQEYMEANNITDVLVLYNVSNFISDKNIYKLN